MKTPSLVSRRAALTTSAAALAALISARTYVQAETVAEANNISEEAALKKYFGMGFDYVDSLVLAAYWGQKSNRDAKIRMGAKMLAFGADDGEFHILAARSQALAKKDDQLPIWIDAGGYKYEDAELLGKFWKSRSTGESKITITRMLIGGHDHVIQAALKAAKSTSTSGEAK